MLVNWVSIEVKLAFIYAILLLNVRIPTKNLPDSVTFPFIISSRVMETEHPTASIVVWMSFDFDNPIAPAASINPKANRSTIAGHTS